MLLLLLFFLLFFLLLLLASPPPHNALVLLLATRALNQSNPLFRLPTLTLRGVRSPTCMQDMRPQLKTYGHEWMKTPNLDALAASGLQFDFAYTQFAYCAPSRNSFLSGRRPERTRALNFLSTFREAPGGQNWTTMPEYVHAISVPLRAESSRDPIHSWPPSTSHIHS
jgi:hypothetical protein